MTEATQYRRRRIAAPETTEKPDALPPEWGGDAPAAAPAPAASAPAPAPAASAAPPPTQRTAQATQTNAHVENPQTGTRTPVSFEAVDFEARAGDQLVCTYPEITLSPKQYHSIKVGGLSYMRILVAGESVHEQFAKVNDYITKRAESDARDRVAKWAREFGVGGK